MQEQSKLWASSFLIGSSFFVAAPTEITVNHAHRTIPPPFFLSVPPFSTSCANSSLYLNQFPRQNFRSIKPSYTATMASKCPFFSFLAVLLLASCLLLSSPPVCAQAPANTLSSKTQEASTRNVRVCVMCVPFLRLPYSRRSSEVASVYVCLAAAAADNPLHFSF